MTKARRPDLVLVMTDQQRHDQVGWLANSAVRTPNLDRLAASGVIFENAYSASTTCVPARTSLMTGLLDHRTPYTDPLSLEQGFFTVPHALRAAGYQTALIGKMHFSPMRADHGFEHLEVCEHLNAYRDDPSTLRRLDHYHDWLRTQGLADWRFELPGGMDHPYPYAPETHPTSWVRDRTLAFLEERDSDRPLFLVVSFPHPHPPLNPPDQYASMYDPNSVIIDPEGAELNRRLPAAFRRNTEQADHPHRRVHPEAMAHHQAELARTYGLITQVDDAVGTIVDQLPLDDSLLWFTSDHGDFAGHRGLLRKIPWIPFDDLAKVPCFATGGRVAGGRREATPVQSFDFATTCLDLAGIDVDLDLLDGVSQRAFLADPSLRPDPDRVVWSAITMKWPMARRGPYKYIRELGWGEEVLFDVDGDSNESLNLAGHPMGLDLARELSAAVDRQLAATRPDLPHY